MIKTLKLLTISALLCSACLAYAQDDDDVYIDGRPIENVIVDRDVYVQLVAESRFTDDTQSLLIEDLNYVRFPAKMYNAQISIADISNFRITSAYSLWENDQGLDITRKSLTIRVPLTKRWSIYPRYLLHKEENATRDYYNLALGGWLSKVYTYTQYGYSKDENGDRRNQLYEYISWQPDSTSIRLGVSGYFSTELNSDDIYAWQGKAFAALPLFKDSTYLHISGAHTDYIDLLQYEEYEASIYQAVGDASSLRLGYRYYEDSTDLYSHAYSAKAKHYFHPRLGVHLGYRRYDHSDGADMNTFFGGFNALL